MKYVLTALEEVAGIFRSHLPIQASISLFIHACDQVLLTSPKMEEQKLLTLCWRSLSGCSRARESVLFPHLGSQYVEEKPWHTNVNILPLTIAYLKATINVILELQDRRLESTGLAKPGEPQGLMCRGPGFARQASAGRVSGGFWNRTIPFLWSKSAPLVGYPDALLILLGVQPTG